MLLLKEWIDCWTELKLLKENLLGMANRLIQEEILTLEKIITKMLERIILTRTLDHLSKKTMQRPPTQKTLNKTLR